MELSEVLKDEFIQTIVKLFQMRRESSRFSKFSEDSPEIIFLNQVPILDRSQINQLSSDLKATKNIGSIFKSIDYQYNINLLKQINERKDNLNEPIIFIVFFQIIACLFCSNVPFSVESYELIIQLLSKKAFLDPQYGQIPNFLFYFLLSTAYDTKSFLWNSNMIKETARFFQINNNFTSSYYDLLIFFLNLAAGVNLDDSDELVKYTLNIIYQLFISNAPIILVNDYTHLLEIIDKYLLEMNTHAVIMLAYISKVDNSADVQNCIQQLPNVFISEVQKRSIQENWNIKIEETEKIHDLPFNITSKFAGTRKDFEDNNLESESQDQISHIPSSLMVEKSSLHSLIPDRIKDISFLFQKFLQLLNKDYVHLFFEKMNEYLQSYANSYGYHVFASYLFLLDLYGDEETLLLNVPLLYKSTKIARRTSIGSSLNQNIPTTQIQNYGISSDFFFDPSKTVFGPYKLDPVLNIFRGTIVSIIFTKCKQLSIKLLEKFEGKPFLMAETIGRYYFYEKDINILFNEPLFIIISKQSLNLQTIGSHIAPQDTIYMLIMLFLRNKTTIDKCLDSKVFVDSFFHYLTIKRYSSHMLNTIAKGVILAYLNKISISMKPTIENFHECVKNSYLRPMILNFIINIVTCCPPLIRLFQEFCDVFIKYLAESPSLSSFNNAILIISYLSNYPEYSQKIDNFQILSNYMKQFGSYTTIYNLILGSTSLPMSSHSLIRKPIFIPFIFVAFGDNNAIISKALDDFLKLMDFSSHNSRALHDGFVDVILIKFLSKLCNLPNPQNCKSFNPQITFGGVKFNINLTQENIKNLVFPIIQKIISEKSSEFVCKKLVKFVTDNGGKLNSSNYYKNEMSNILCKVLSQNTNINQPLQNFTIGNLNPFLKIKGIPSSIFNEKPFTCNFWLKLDQTLLLNSTSSILLLSISDTDEHHQFSIMIENNSLFLAFDEGNQRTIVAVCQKLAVNKWTQYCISISNEVSESGRISVNTYQNFEKTSECEFCTIKFNSGPITIKLGGFEIFKARKPNFPNEVFGFLSNFSVFPRAMNSNEILLLLTNDFQDPKDYIFSTTNLTINNIDTEKPQKSFSNSNFNHKIIIPSKYNEIHFNYCYSYNHYPIQPIQKFIYNQKYINILINSISKTNFSNREFGNSLMYLKLNLLEKCISSITDKHISASFASNLYHLNSTTPILSYKLFKSLLSITMKIEDKVIQRYWVEDILVNIPLWKSSKCFNKVLYEYGSTLIIKFTEIWKQKSYFSYFLNQFNETCCIESNKTLLPLFSLFLQRIAQIRFDIEDSKFLGSLISYWNDNPKNIQTYFLIVSKMAYPINQITGKYKFKNLMTIYLKFHDVNVVIGCIIAMSALFRNSFHKYIIAIVHAIPKSISKDLLYEKLNSILPYYPNLYPLLCAIALEVHKKPTSIPSNIILSDYWYIFPILLLLRYSDFENLFLIHFIATNAIKSPDCIEEIISFCAYLNIFVKHECSNPLNLILRSFLQYSQKYDNQDIVYKIFMNSFSSYLFHMNAPTHHRILLKINEKFGIGSNDVIENKFDEVGIKNIQKFEIKSIHDFKRFSEIDLNQVNFRFYLEYDESLYSTSNEAQERKLIDYSLLAEADAISDTLMNYEIPNTTSKPGNVFTGKSKEFCITMKDIKEFINGLLKRKLQTLSIEVFAKRNKIIKYLRKTFVKTIKTAFDNNNIKEMYQNASKIDALIKDASKVSKDQSHLGGFSLYKVSLYESFSSKEKLRCSFQLNVGKPEINTQRSNTMCFAQCPFLFERVKRPPDIKRFLPKPINIDSNCRILSCYHQPLQASISIESKTIRIKTRKSLTVLNPNDVLAILHINDHSLLIISTTNVPYLLELNRDILEKILTDINDLNLNVLSSYDALIELIPKLQFDWMNNSISTFKYLSYLNILSGRLYDSKNFYPLFPPPHKLSNMTKCDTSIPEPNPSKNFVPEVDKIKKESIFYPPEMYYMYDTINDVYNNRKQLERIDNIDQWINFVFGNSKYKHLQLFNRTTVPQTAINKNKENNIDPPIMKNVKLICNCPHPARLPIHHKNLQPQQINLFNENDIFTVKFSASMFYQNGFAVVLSDGSIKFIQIVFDENGHASYNYITAPKKLNFSTQQKFGYINTGLMSNIMCSPTKEITYGLVAYDNKEINIITEHRVYTHKHVCLQNPLFAGPVFIASPSFISRTSFFFNHKSEGPIPTSLYNVHCPITCLDSSVTFSIFVIGGLDGKIRIRSIKNGKKIKTVKLDEEIPVKILITECWGFILVQTINKLFVLSVNGKIMKKIDNFPKFTKWFPFHTRDDFDFVVFIDENFQIMYFEAINPDQLFSVTDLNTSIEAIKFDYRTECFIILTTDGKLFIFPHTIDMK